MQKPGKLLIKSFVITLSMFLILVADMQAQQSMQNMLNDINYREIGPTRDGGRYVDFAVVKQDPTIIYAATGSGGLWKSYDNALTWKPIFDHESVISIGDVAVAPSDSNIVWVGTGEANNSRSTYWGDGVYKSTDAGKTWTNMGLPESHHIGRIISHPTNPDIVYVAALGHLYSENPERGLYRTTDGGKSWEKVLDVKVRGKNIGVVDVVMDPDNPDILLASTYDKVRRPWTFNPGGPGSRIYKSTDGGDSWKKLEDGLPGGMLGRIGLAFAPSNPNVLYANIENVNIPGMSDEERYADLKAGRPSDGKVIGDQIYRSDDLGESWYLTHPKDVNVGGGPAYYYQQVRVDPTDENHVYVLGARMYETRDGGKTWGRPFNFGGDNHAMWIDPENPRHLLLGYDHGMGYTYDAGKNWYHTDNIPLAQFYAVDYDMSHPYNVYGGLQDNGSAKGPSTKRGGGPILMEDWKRTGGGDGMYNVVDKSNNRYLYNESQFGPLTRVDQITGKRSSIAYRNIDRSMRWNWTSPILISPHNNDVIYHGGNKVVKSTYRGENWKVISPDLSNQDSSKIVGTGNIQYATITSLDESPVTPDELWAGTDDGNVWMSSDGGKNWTKLNDRIKGNPGYWVSRVVASPNTPGTAYVTYTGYRRDDFRPFIYKTTDYGKTWESIASNLPDESINVVREDPDNPNLLYLGTDMHVYISTNGGKKWYQMKGDMPTNPIHDLKVHPREHELIVATHGRGIFITDIAPFKEFSGDLMDKDFHLFNIKPVVRWIDNGNNHSDFNNFNGESRPSGITINYYLKNKADDGVTIQVMKSGRVIYELEGAGEAGMNKAVWNEQKRLRKRTEKEKKQVKQRMERLREFGLSESQIKQYVGDINYVTTEAPLGTYTIKVISGSGTQTDTVEIKRDYWFRTYNDTY